MKQSFKAGVTFMFSVIVLSLTVVKMRDGMQVYSCNVTDIEFGIFTFSKKCINEQKEHNIGLSVIYSFTFVPIVNTLQTKVTCF